MAQLNIYTRMNMRKVIKSGAASALVMREIGIIVAVLCLVLPESPARSSERHAPPRLAGIVSLPDRCCAVLTLAAAPKSSAKWFILSQGQRDGDMEVVGIAADKGSADLRWPGAGSVTVSLRNATNLPLPGVVLEDASLNVVLSLFDQLTNRSLLRWPSLPAATFSLRAATTDRVGAAQVLAQALVKKGLSIIPDGKKFLMIVPASEVARVNPHAPLSKSPSNGVTELQPAPPGSKDNWEEVMPPGVIDFRGADVRQVADIYSLLASRKLDLSGSLGFRTTIYFRSQTPLTKAEAVYALGTLLRWSGVNLASEGEDEPKR
jgi:hypothetical protein